EQDDTFKESFVELARVTRGAEKALTKCVEFLEAHRPGHRRRRPPKLLIDEVGQPPKEQPEGCAGRDIIVDAQPVELLLVREIENAERGADHTAVERHAAVPQLQDFDRVTYVLVEIVEQYVAEAPSEDDPQRGVEDKVVGVTAGERCAWLLDQLQQVPIADEDP